MQDVMHVIARAIIIKDEKLLVVMGRSAYFLPGGHVEKGESVAAALQREIQEELGFPCSIQRFLGCLETEHIDPTAHDCHRMHACHDAEYKFVFLVDVPGLSADTDPKSPERELTLKWVLLSSLPEINFQPHALKKVLPEWLAAQHKTALVHAWSARPTECYQEGNL